MQPAPFEARIQHYDRHPHIRTQSGPSSAGPVIQRHSTVIGFTQPAMMYAEPMPPELPMVHPPILFGPPPPPPMGVPPEFMGMPNGDSGVMSSAMLADAMLDVAPPHGGMGPLGPPGHDMVPFHGPGDMEHEMAQFQSQEHYPPQEHYPSQEHYPQQEHYQPPEHYPAPSAMDHYQLGDSKSSPNRLPRHQRMVAAIKQRLGRAAEKQSIRYGAISQRMFEPSPPPPPPPPQTEANAGGPSRQNSLGRRRSVRQTQVYASNLDSPDAMQWCFRRQRRLKSLQWEPFDRIYQSAIKDASNQNKPCVIQDSHFPQMIKVIPSDGYAICRKMRGHVLYDVAFLDPTKQSRTVFFCIPMRRRRNPSHLQ
jgi:hypothetical protein